MKEKLYLASPLFNDREREFNAYIENLLLNYFDVYLPQRDGLLLKDLLRRGILPSDAELMVFNADVAAMDECSIVLAVFDGPHIDEGVAFEVGYMFAQGKKCVALQTDFRRQLPTGNNPMLNKSIAILFTSIEQLLEWAQLDDQYRQELSSAMNSPR